MDNQLSSIFEQFVKIISIDSKQNENEILEALKLALTPYIEEYKNPSGSDDLVKKALKYILYTHAFPRSGASVHTYVSMLESLLELAHPLATQDGDESIFLEDIEKGIKWSQKNALK